MELSGGASTYNGRTAWARNLATPVRDFLTENEVPSDLVEELFKHLPTEVYWLTEHDEEMLGVKSAAFQKFLAKNCAWDDALEKAVFRGERLEEMKAFSACRIRVTLAAMPRRTTALAAKAAVLTGPVLVAGAVAVLGSVLAGRLILPGHGIGPAHGYPDLSLTSGPVLRAAVGSVLYLTLIALLSLGIAAAVRDGAAAIGIVLGLLYLFPILGQVVGSGTWHRHLEQLAPMTAGLAIQATTGLRSLPISPWAGLGVLAGWTAAALLTGVTLLSLRDA